MNKIKTINHLLNILFAVVLTVLNVLVAFAIVYIFENSNTFLKGLVIAISLYKNFRFVDKLDKGIK